jgi:hypothetical protein
LNRGGNPIRLTAEDPYSIFGLFLSPGRWSKIPGTMSGVWCSDMMGTNGGNPSTDYSPVSVSLHLTVSGHMKPLPALPHREALVLESWSQAVESPVHEPGRR